MLIVTIEQCYLSAKRPLKHCVAQMCILMAAYDKANAELYCHYREITRTRMVIWLLEEYVHRFALYASASVRTIYQRKCERKFIIFPRTYVPILN